MVSKKSNALLKHNYIFRIIGLLSGDILLLSIVKDYTHPMTIIMVTVGLVWPHIGYFLASHQILSKNHFNAEKRNFYIDSFIYGMVTYYTSFNLLISIAMWISNIVNTISVSGIKLLLRSLFFFLLGIISLYPFLELKIQPNSNPITIVLCLLFITIYTTVTATNLFNTSDSNRKKRKQIQKINNKLEIELEFARLIQINLMPSDKPLPNIACLYKPMGKIGGDFYDFIKFRESNKIGIFISDVSGHGVPAAFITSMLKSFLLMGGEKKDNPAELLMYINNILYKQIDFNFITAFYGVYDPTERTLTYSNAGHNLPLLIHSSIEPLKESNHQALAMFNNKELNKKIIYTNHEKILPIGSKLLLYTDGLTEARSQDGEIFFADSMNDILLKNSNKDCDDFVDTLYKELLSFHTHESFDDDICIICLDVK